MATFTPTLRPLSCWKALIRQSRQHKAITARSLTLIARPKEAHQFKYNLPPWADPTQKRVKRVMKEIPPPPTPRALFKDPVKSFQDDQIAVLDPTGARTHLFSRANPESAKVGDILMVRLKSGDPYSGVCINIRRRGVETAILLRNQLTRVGVEMWYKIYSPNVEGIEVVQRAMKRARRERLTYMRKPSHDMGSVQNIVLQYQRSKTNLSGMANKAQEGLKGGTRKIRKGRKH